MADTFENFIKWMDSMGYELTDLQKEVVKAVYEKRMIIRARQCGRASAMGFLKEYYANGGK